MKPCHFTMCPALLNPKATWVFPSLLRTMNTYAHMCLSKHMYLLMKTFSQTACLQS